jgi:hypothetical protein
LAGISSYFRNLFKGEWSERAGDDDKRKRFIIKEQVDFDMAAFTMMLNSAMMAPDNCMGGGGLEGRFSTLMLF